MRQYIACADDMLVLGRTVTATEEAVRQVREAAVSTGLVINESKTKHLQVTETRQMLRMDREVVEGAQNFRYLGTLIS
jgi:hypothetical protein